MVNRGPPGTDRRAVDRATTAEPTTAEPTTVGRWWPKWLPSPKIVCAVLVVGALAVLVVRERASLAQAFRHVGVGSLPWLAAAVGAEALSFVCYAGVQRRLLRAGGARLGRRTVLGLAVSATGLTNLVPGGTAPASGWLVGQYRRHGIPMPLALWAVLAGGFAATVTVLTLLLVGAAVAGLIGIVAIVGCAVALIGGSVGIVVAVHHVGAVERWLAGRHRVRLAERVAGWAAQMVRFRATASGGTEVFALSFGNWGLDVLCLVAAFGGLGLPVPWRSVLFAYAAAQVAGSVAPLPGGIGFVEGGMIGALALTGTPPADAVAATLIYRVITTFGVAGIGTVALFVVSRREPEPAQLDGDAARLAGEAGAPTNRRPPPATPGAEPRGETNIRSSAPVESTW
jgi:putative heme transporter